MQMLRKYAFEQNERQKEIVVVTKDKALPTGKVLFVFVQGSCVLWYNLYPTGAGDFKTRHAACPVLSGTKWGQFVC